MTKFEKSGDHKTPPQHQPTSLPTMISRQAISSLILLLSSCVPSVCAFEASSGNSVSVDVNTWDDRSAPFRRLGTNSTAISDLEIVGWWSECASTPSASTGLCAGTFEPLNIPIVLDPTGNTCYVNPAANYPAVQWLGGIPNANGKIVSTDASETVFYTLILTTELLRAQFFPTNCTAGECSCDTIEPLRKGWDTAPNGNLSAWCQYNTLCRIYSIIPDVGNCTNWETGVIYHYENETNLQLCFPLGEVQPKGFKITSAASTTSFGALTLSAFIVGALSLIWSF